ncbi:MAG: prepilin-type N-terminal cleavage/methylation domain-containing protein [Candidatus Thiodiazotropha sp. L084R]
MLNHDHLEQLCRGRPRAHILSGGFTLLEIMIALLLLAVITTTSVSMLFLNIKGWERVSESSEVKIAEYLASARIEHLIRNLLPFTWQQKRARQLAFSGDAQHIQFIAPAPQQYQSGGLFEYRLAQERDSELGLSLVLYYAPYYPNIEQFSLPEEGRRRVLISGLQYMEFSFYGKPQNRPQPEWTDQWEQTYRYFPELIKISHTEEGLDLPQERYVRIRRKST